MFTVFIVSVSIKVNVSEIEATKVGWGLYMLGWGDYWVEYGKKEMKIGYIVNECSFTQTHTHYFCIQSVVMH